MKDASASNVAWLVLILVVAVGWGAWFDAPAPFTKKDLARALVRVRDGSGNLSLIHI